MNITSLDDTVSVSSQPLLDDFEDIAADGFKSVINNRPDGEKAGYPDAAAAAEAAREAGLDYRHIPLVPGRVTPEILTEFARALEDMPKPVLAHCATGKRSTILWALTHVRTVGVDGVIAKAAEAGHDLDELRTPLQAMAAQSA